MTRKRRYKLLRICIEFGSEKQVSHQNEATKDNSEEHEERKQISSRLLESRTVRNSLHMIREKSKRDTNIAKGSPNDGHFGIDTKVLEHLQKDQKDI